MPVQHSTTTDDQPSAGGVGWSGRAGLEAIYDALRAGLITWDSVLRSHERHYPPCAVCGTMAKFHSADMRPLCDVCYLPVARAEMERGR